MTRSDPHRRPLRHTYQEGPGFLFLATRGGRPPRPRAREDLRALRFRIRCVRTAEDEGVAAALALGVSRTSLHRWRRRYAAGGIEALRWQPRGPARQWLPAWVERIVIVVRLLTYWNSKRLAAEFTRRDIYPLDHNAVDHVLAEYGTARPGVHRERGPAYERSRPDELWHIDIKGPFWLQRAPGDYTKVWIVGLVDDHSRSPLGFGAGLGIPMSSHVNGIFSRYGLWPTAMVRHLISRPPSGVMSGGNTASGRRWVARRELRAIPSSRARSNPHHLAIV